MLYPTALLALSLIDHVPTPNENVGFWAVLNTISVLLPGVRFLQVQTHDVGVFVEVSLKTMGSMNVPDCGLADVKLATGGEAA